MAIKRYQTINKLNIYQKKFGKLCPPHIHDRKCCEKNLVCEENKKKIMFCCVVNENIVFYFIIDFYILI